MLACARRYNYVDRQFRSGNYKVRFGLTNTYELLGKTWVLWAAAVSDVC